MKFAIIACDMLAMGSALVAAVLWFTASRRRMRRISYREELNAADLNRMVVAINRAQILNARAALAASTSAVAVGARLLLDLIRHYSF